MPVETSSKQSVFFRFAFGDNTGIVCIARRAVGTDVFVEEFFQYPNDLDKMLGYIDRFTPTNDIWYCPQLLSGNSRTKVNVICCPSLWADLDNFPPDKLFVTPTLLIESSPNRHQALWVLNEPLAPVDAERMSKRIAYHHADQGCDKSGWDLTQLLRVPFTFNHKYGGVGQAPQVLVASTNKTVITVEDFSGYPEVKSEVEIDIPIPEAPQTANEIIMKYRSALHPLVYVLFSQEPKQDWSKVLWSLELLLFECGLEPAEVFAVVREAACNKYDRDGRHEAWLWKDVLRAYAEKHIDVQEIKGDKPELLSADERNSIQPCIVEDYIAWAGKLGDAAIQYHEAGIFTILSAILSTSVRLPTSFGTIIPNLWFMISANTTITRKSTAMDIAMDLLDKIDPDAVLATDGSIEGLFSALSTRPGRASIFLRDEFSGLLDMMAKKDYYAGMAESLTKLYDGKLQKRILRRETIEVREPVFLIFAGGIRNRILELLNYDLVLSGFLPRFIFIFAEGDITKIKPMGPPTIFNDKKKQELIDRLTKLHKHFNKPAEFKIGEQINLTKRIWNAELTDDAWRRYNVYETTLVDYSMYSRYSNYLMPMMDRMAKSTLKVAVMLACLRMEDKVVVTEQDIVHAISYADKWVDWSCELIANIEKTAYERLVDQIVHMVTISGDAGIDKPEVLRTLKLSARQADDLFRTVEERGLMQRFKNGRSERLFKPGVRQV